MLRLRKVDVGFTPDRDGERTETWNVLFDGFTEGDAFVEVTLHMKPRASDAELLADAQRILSAAISQLHRDHCGPDSPGS